MQPHLLSPASAKTLFPNRVPVRGPGARSERVLWGDIQPTGNRLGGFFIPFLLLLSWLPCDPPDPAAESSAHTAAGHCPYPETPPRGSPRGKRGSHLREVRDLGRGSFKVQVNKSHLEGRGVRHLAVSVGKSHDQDVLLGPSSWGRESALGAGSPAFCPGLLCTHVKAGISRQLRGLCLLG